jgi:hypothetical protein
LLTPDDVLLWVWTSPFWSEDGFVTVLPDGEVATLRELPEEGSDERTFPDLLLTVFDDRLVLPDMVPDDLSEAAREPAVLLWLLPAELTDLPEF